jgi:hypothetical protein
MQTGFRRIRIKTEIKNTFPVIAGMFLFLLAVSPYGVLLLLPPEDFRYALMKEDGFFETVAAACWLCCSAVFFYLYAADRSGNDFVLCKTRRNIFLLLLAGLFFAGFGEEISWGQRIFGIQTPPLLAELNEQQELNVHNLAGMKVESLFSLFWFSYAFIIPLLVRLSRPVAAFLNRINLPVMPLWIGALFPVNYLVSKLLEPYFSGTETNFPIEAKEFVFAMLFLAAGVSLVREYRAMRD